MKNKNFEEDCKWRTVPISVSSIHFIQTGIILDTKAGFESLTRNYRPVLLSWKVNCQRTDPLQFM